MKRINSWEDRVLRSNQEERENLNRSIINENEEKRMNWSFESYPEREVYNQVIWR